jgi:thymidylate kinase
MKVFIFEGARGTGKTTQARNVRQKISEITLVNPTGFHDDGIKGYMKIIEYYNSWLAFLQDMSDHDSKIVFDRFFFTERVFSELYKDYDFSYYFKPAVKDLVLDNEVTVLFFTINNEEELVQRLNRDKVPFGKVAESVEETLKQQELYRKILNESKGMFGLNLIEIDTTGKTPEEVEDEVFKIVGGK